MADGFNLDALIDKMAERVVARLKGQINQAPNVHVVRPRLLTVEQAGQYLSRSSASVRHLINAGKLPVARLDGRVFLDVVDLDRIIEESKQLAK